MSALTKNRNFDDAKSLLIIFPEELWCSIVANITNSRDYHNTCKVCPYFNKLLTRHRIRILFPSILEILDKQKLSWKHYLQDLSTLRHVCRSWKNGVDSMTGSVEHQAEYLRPSANRFTVILQSLAKLQAFEIHFMETHLNCQANPFPARRVSLQIPEDKNQLAAFCANWLKICGDYGNHIRQLYVMVNMLNYGNQMLFYQKLKQMLQLMPSLNLLSFDIQTRRQISEEYVTSTLAPFPKLPNLIIIDQHAMHFPEFMALLQPNVESIKRLKTKMLNTEHLLLFLELKFSYLEILSLDASDLALDWPTLFSGLEKCCGETLTHLDIALPANALCVLDDVLDYQLSNVKTLCVRSKCLPSLDVLLGMRRNLENLTVNAVGDTNSSVEKVAKGEEIVKFYGHLNNLHKSNIWTWFPKLQNVAFSIIVWNSRSRQFDDVFRTYKRKDCKRKKKSKCNIM